MKQFKPELLPNNKAGEAPNWEALIQDPQEWIYSNKLDGCRVELFGQGPAKGRSLKPIESVHIQAMVADIQSVLNLPEQVVLECEFYSGEMNFAEIMHFFRSEDVTSEKSVKKYEGLWRNDKWPFPGRTVEWATSWHDSLKLYAFNVLNTIGGLAVGKYARCEVLHSMTEEYTKGMGQLSLDLINIRQNSFDHIDELYQAYDQAIMDGYEGVVVHKKKSMYKFGRHTLKSNQVYKLKNDNCEFDGLIIGVEEGDVAIEGAPKTVNELGRSVRSKLKEHRQPSGMAKGLKVKMDDGNVLIVSLKDFDHPARIKMLQEPLKWIGETIRFTGMPAVKEGGCPRHAHFTKGNVRDEK
jgi:hypothetical protein